MKVIGQGANGAYLCEVSHTELEKLTDKYYGKLEKQGIGSEINLGAGYDFRADIQAACRNMTEAVKGFDRAQNTLMKFALMVGDLPEPATPAKGESK